MANDKYDAFPQPIIILLLDLFLVCRWQQRATEGTERGGARGHRLERYKRVRRTGEPQPEEENHQQAQPPLDPPHLPPLLTSFLRLSRSSERPRSSVSPPLSSTGRSSVSVRREPPRRGTDATAEILIINSIPFVTRSIYFGAQRSLRAEA